MSQLFIQSGQGNPSGPLKNRPVVAVDLGFSNKGKSCGVAFQNKSPSCLCSDGLYTFARCVTEVANFIDQHDRIVLIVEAPLSYLFDRNDNPVGRSFEQRQKKPLVKGIEHRYWYEGAGASTCISAQFFIKALLKRIKQKPNADDVVLYEGFLTFKNKGRPSNKMHHLDDAKLLLDCFIGNKPYTICSVNPSKGETMETVVDFVSGNRLTPVAPDVIVPT